MTADELSVGEANERFDAVIEEIESTVIGDRDFFREVLLGFIARGHVLMEDVPGTGKTLTARSFATAFGLSFSRIQFTPDLLPTDVTGTNIYNEEEGSFDFQPGPIFSNIILADEINRAPPKTQAALLEAMGEKQVTTEGETRQLPEPFFVIATQNPVEQEGTFPLPEAQVDRFMIKTSLGYPERDGYLELIDRRATRTAQAPSAETVLAGSEEVRALQQVPETITVHDDLRGYLVDIIQLTQSDNRVRVGGSPRGLQRLFEAVRTRAAIEGRSYVTPDDVKAVAASVLAHRLVLTAEAQVNEVNKRDVIADILDEVTVPTVEAPD